MANPFDRFDKPSAPANPFDKFDAPEPPEVAWIRQGFREQGPAKIASGNLMGIPDEINSAGAAAIDRVLGRTNDWNERRKQYRKAFKEERAAAEQQLGGVGTFAADFAGGMAAAPFQFANRLAPAVSALPLPMVGTLKPALPPAQTAAQAIMRPAVETARNLPALAATGGAYGVIGGAIGSPEDDAASRGANALYSGLAGTVLGPALHLGLGATGQAVQSGGNLVRGAWEKATGTTPPQRQAAATQLQELIDAGVNPNEVYGPFLRPDGGTWFSRGIGSSAGGYHVSKRAADRHVTALERELGQELASTGAPRAKYTAGDDRQQFLDRMVNRQSIPSEVIENLDDATRAAMAAPLETMLPPRQPSPQSPPPQTPHPHERHAPGLNSLTMYGEAGPLAETAPAFLRRPIGSMGKALQERQGVPPPAAPSNAVGARGRGLEGEALPPEAAQQPRLPPPEQAPPTGAGIPYDPSLTYKDRVAALYENLHREIPGQAKGGLGTVKRPHTQDVETNKVIEDIRRQARAERRLPGDEPKVDWWDSPVRDLIEKEVRRFVPPDFATSLFARDGNHPAVRQIMKYRTEVRNADTSNPMTRTVDQTWLPRLEEALTKDRNARLAAIDTKTGGQALERAQNADRQYAALKEHHVAPLKPILGDNVRPEQAMDRLTRAMGGKDLTMIRAYTHAHRMARQEIEGAGAVVAHLMEGGVGNFVEKYATFNPAAKAELFSGQARSLGTALDRYARLAAPAVEARSDMRFRPISGHSSALAISYVLHNITGVITTALGQYGAARFLTSPRYVNWLTRASVATGRQPSAWDGQLQALLSMAGSDQSELGRDIEKALRERKGYKP
jgi:hypothetical protein